VKRYATACATLLVAAWACADPLVHIEGIAEGQTIGGIYHGIEAIVDSQAPVDRVEFYLDGHLFRIETVPPYCFNGDYHGAPYGWDTTIYPNGSYRITAIAFDTDELSGLAEVAFSIFNNHPPTASCEADPVSGNVPLTVQFTGNAYDPDNQELEYGWTFGDGGQSPLQHPQHTFNVPGVYIVRFTVVDPNSASASSRTCVRAGILPYLEEEGVVVMEAENYDMWRENQTGAEWAKRTDEPGYSGTGFIQHVPDIGVVYGPATEDPSVEYWIDILQTGRYYLWLRGYARAGSAACRVSSNGLLLDGAIEWKVYNTWEWVNSSANDTVLTLDIEEAGLNVLAVHGAEDGLAIDRILLTTDPFYEPAGAGPAASARDERLVPLPGDVNGDWVVNILDLIYVRNNLGADLSQAPTADANEDGRINVLDLIFVRNHLGLKAE